MLPVILHNKSKTLLHIHIIKLEWKKRGCEFIYTWRNLELTIMWNNRTVCFILLAIMIVLHLFSRRQALIFLHKVQISMYLLFLTKVVCNEVIKFVILRKFLEYFWVEEIGYKLIQDNNETVIVGGLNLFSKHFSDAGLLHTVLSIACQALLCIHSYNKNDFHFKHFNLCIFSCLYGLCPYWSNMYNLDS